MNISCCKWNIRSLLTQLTADSMQIAVVFHINHLELFRLRLKLTDTWLLIDCYLANSCAQIELTEIGFSLLLSICYCFFFL